MKMATRSRGGGTSLDKSEQYRAQRVATLASVYRESMTHRIIPQTMHLHLIVLLIMHTLSSLSVSWTDCMAR